MSSAVSVRVQRTSARTTSAGLSGARRCRRRHIGLLANTTRYCTDVGCNAIVGGILVASRYREMLRGAIAEHPGPSHIFCLEVSVDEALRRHQERPRVMEVSTEEFRRCYVPSDLLDARKVVLDATEDIEVTSARSWPRLATRVFTPRCARRFL